MSKLARATPQFGVLERVEEAQQYYRDVLGFRIDWTWENIDGSVSRDGTTIFSPNSGERSPPCGRSFPASEADELCAEWKGQRSEDRFRSGGQTVGAPANSPSRITTATARELPRDRRNRSTPSARAARRSPHRSPRAPSIGGIPSPRGCRAMDGLQQPCRREKSLPPSPCSG